MQETPLQSIDKLWKLQIYTVNQRYWRKKCYTEPWCMPWRCCSKQKGMSYNKVTTNCEDVKPIKFSAWLKTSVTWKFSKFKISYELIGSGLLWKNFSARNMPNQSCKVGVKKLKQLLGNIHRQEVQTFTILYYSVWLLNTYLTILLEL